MLFILRFLPVIDPQVDIFFSRDLDSRISEREVAAVKEFLNSEEQVRCTFFCEPEIFFSEFINFVVTMVLHHKTVKLLDIAL